MPVGAEGSLKTARIVGSGRLKGHVLRARGRGPPNLKPPGPLSSPPPTLRWRRRGWQPKACVCIVLASAHSTQRLGVWMGLHLQVQDSDLLVRFSLRAPLGL